MLGGARVVDMKEQEEDVVHVVDAPPGNSLQGPVRGVVDAARRRDFMAQHTGEHILAQALLRAGGLRTVSVHFGEDTTTIELETPTIGEDVLQRAEELANSAIMENHRVIIHEVDHSEASRFPLRRKPPEVGTLRIVEIEGWDWVGCSGIHVPSTGHVLLVKIVGQEKMRGHARIHAIIGARALADYGRKAALTQALEPAPHLRGGERPFTRGGTGAKREREGAGARQAAAGTGGSGRGCRRRKGAARGGSAHRQWGVRRRWPGYLKAFVERIVASPGRAAIAMDRSPDAFQWIVAHSLGERLELPKVVTPLLGAGRRRGGRSRRVDAGGRPAAGAAAFASALEEALSQALR